MIVSTAHELSGFSAADVADGLRELGVFKSVMKSIHAQQRDADRIVGPARTLRMLPEREDISLPINGVNRALYESILPGEIVVIDAMGDRDHAIVGDMMSLRLIAKNVSGVIVDGAVRDIDDLPSDKPKLFARGRSPGVFMNQLRPWESDCAIQCGGVLVQPRDVIVADGDGVVVVPQAMASKLAANLKARAAQDAFSRALLQAGYPLDDAYPLPAHMRQHLAEFQRSGALPQLDDPTKTRN